MRKGVKKQVLGLLATVSEALHYVKTTKNKDECPMLENCLLCMESIIKTIGCSENENDMVSNSAKRFGQDLLCAQHSVDCPREFKKALFSARRELALIRCEVEKIKPRLEFVFLPYKASMWDSFESIWRSAQADSSCDAYVVPVPYYDLNPDRTVSRLNYEGGLFPADVPIVDYRKYNFEERRPDVVFIHNPYDGYNRVTSIAAEFHSDKLKMYADMLVYVPYDVVTDLVSEHMCRMPGVMNADLIIVQSQQVKEVYTKYVSDEKVLALGSPKIDKVVWNREHMPEMPELWDKIARGRKLILYNTHLSPLMIDDGIVCKKLRYVFSCFKEREDVCLLWRPHPLSQATMEAMNPRRLKEYMELVEEYKRTRLGIYDDTPDVHRAIALSDAYFGDDSSLMPMYGVTGKPIMLQTLKVYGEQKSEEAKGYLSFFDSVVDGDVMWFSACHFNGLFKMDLKNGKCSFMGKFPGEMESWMLYCKVIKANRKLFFIPWLANSIAVFDLDTLKFTAYDLPEMSRSLFPKAISAVLRGDWICSIPAGISYIFKFNIRSGELKIYDEWYRSLIPFIENQQEIFIRDWEIIGDYAWCPFAQGNLVLKFDLSKMTVQIFKVGDQGYAYSSISFDGKNFWLASLVGAIIRWNPKTFAVHTYDGFSERIRGDGISWIYCRHNNGKLYIFGGQGEIFILQIDSEKILEYTRFPANYKREGNSIWTLKFARPEIVGDAIYVFSILENAYLQVQTNTDECVVRKILLQADELEKLNWPDSFFDLWKSEMKNIYAYPYFENSILSLPDYLDFIIHKKINKKNTDDFFAQWLSFIDGECGRRIHESVRRILQMRC